MAHLENTREQSAQGVPPRLNGNIGVVLSRLERWAPVLLITLLLVVWEWQSNADRMSALFFPAPSTIAQTFKELVASGQMTTHLVATARRLFAGFFIGGTSGLILGLAMGWSTHLRNVFDPLVAAAHPIPKIAIFPLIIILFGIGEASKIVIIALATFFPMLINSMAGVRQISPTYFEVAKNYGARAGRLLWRVILPGSLPLILAGVRLALNSALVLTIAIELITAQEGLGALIGFAWRTLRTGELYASLGTIAVLGISFNVFVHLLMIRLVPWHKEQSA